MNDTQPSPNLRAIAAQVVFEVVEQHKSLSDNLPAAIEPLEARDRALVQEMVFGTCRWYLYLLECVQPLLNKPIPKRYQRAQALLAVGSYQLLFMRSAKHAVINETVEACQKLGLTPLKGLFNAILRQLGNTDEALPESAPRSSHPLWMQEKLGHNWPEQAEQIFVQNNQRPPMTLRVNRLRTTRDDYLERLRKEGIEAQPCRFSANGIVLEQPVAVERLPDFELGACSVQDEAAQLCVDLMDLSAGQRVLDACAAPGGKTCAMLEANNDISMLALDQDAQRAKRISENLTRLALHADIKVAAAENPEHWWDGKQFDRILLDVPCSATGVIRRHPDIKHLREQKDLSTLAEMQLKILQQVWKTLASGGKLVYATCSIFPQENQRIIERFLKQEPGAHYIETDAEWGIETGYGRQLFPSEQGHDGFFYACLEKSN